MRETPLVTIAMPCLNEAEFIESSLNNVLAQDYPPDRFEVIVADGGSTDGTRDIVTRFSARNPRVTMVDNPGRVQSAGLNAAIRRSRGDVIIRMDVHSDYATDFVRKSIEVLERTGAQNAGGAARTRYKTPFQGAVCAALRSPLGVGGSSYRSGLKEGWVDTIFAGAYPRHVFEQVGLFDPRAITNEDAEMNQRIHEAGGRVYLSRELVVHYYPRGSFTSLAKQYFKYGRGRARTMLKHRGLPKIRPLIPAMLVVGGIVAIATAPFQPLTPFLFGAFAALTGLEAVRVGREGGALQVLTVWAIFPTLYVAHGLGFWSGLAHYLRNPDWGPTEFLPARAAEQGEALAGEPAKVASAGGAR